MAGGNHPVKDSSASHCRKESPKPYPSGPENMGPPPPPAYGFHMLHRRTIILADGSVRSYFALPPDYRHFAPPLPSPPMDPELRLGFDPEFQIPGEDNPSSHKRKYDDEFTRQRQRLLQHGNVLSNSNGPGPSNTRASKYVKKSHDIDQAKLKSAFLNFVRLINENANQKKKYLTDGKLQCVACGRSSKDYPDMHSLIMHVYNSESAMPGQVYDHLGLHKALCILMGWNYSIPPDNSKAYQLLSAEEAAANRDDLIIWPPHVIIRNTITGKGKDGRMEGIGNKAMDTKLRDLGFRSGKSKSMYGKEGHMGTTIVKFGGDESGLKDAIRLAELFEKEKHGRGAWASLKSGKDDENDPNLVKLDKKSGEKERVLYGYLGTAFDLDALDYENRKKVAIKSKRFPPIKHLNTETVS